MHTILGILTLTLTSTPFLGFLYLEHISFITNNLHQMCLMLDQFLFWGGGGGIRHVTVTFLVL